MGLCSPQESIHVCLDHAKRVNFMQDVTDAKGDFLYLTTISCDGLQMDYDNSESTCMFYKEIAFLETDYRQCGQTGKMTFEWINNINTCDMISKIHKYN